MKQARSVLALSEILKNTGELSSGYDSSAVNGIELDQRRGKQQGPSQLEAAYASLPVENLYPDDPNALVITRL